MKPGKGFVHQQPPAQAGHETHKGWSCSIDLGDDKITLEHIDIAPGECLVIPYHLRMGNALLLRTNASLLCRLGKYYVFYTDHQPWYHYRKEPGCVITLKHQEAERAYKFGDRLVIADCILYEDNGEIFAVSQKPAEEIIYYLPDGARRSKMVAFTQAKCEVKFTYLGTGGEDGQYKAYEITINAKDLDKVHDLFLQIDYQGDRAEIYHEEADRRLVHHRRSVARGLEAVWFSSEAGAASLSDSGECLS